MRDKTVLKPLHYFLFKISLDVAMFPMMPAQGNKEERQLIKLYQSLTDTDRQTLFSFAEFLQAKNKGSDSVDNQNPVDKPAPTEPLEISRPDEESVIKAIKRLTKNYPMVDKETILHPISGLMTSHILQGRAASEVIDDLEALFLKEYKNIDNFDGLDSLDDFDNNNMSESSST